MSLRKIISCFFFVFSIFSVNVNVNAEETETYTSYVAPLNLGLYITDKSHSAFHFTDDKGELISKLLVGSYKTLDLIRDLKAKICYGVYQFNCEYNLDNIKLYTGVDLNQESSLADSSITKINAYRVVYTSQGLNKQDHSQLSAAVLIPQSDQPLKGVVIFYHFTVLNKQNIPSNFDRDWFHLSRLLASTLASDGYTVVIPDYPGFGVDQDSIHPYIVYPQVNALSGINLLKVLPLLEPKLSYQLDQGRVPLFISGYSEGASYALWAAKLLQDNPQFLKRSGFLLTKTIPIAGVYNISNVTLPFLLGNSKDALHKAPFFAEDARVAAYVKPGMVANFLNSYSYYDLNNDESMVFAPVFMNCANCDEIKVDKGGQYQIADLVQSSSIHELGKYEMFYNRAKKTGYNLEDNSAALLTNQELLNSKDFKDKILAANIYNWRSLTPISFLTFEYDSVVSPLNTETAYQRMAKESSFWVKATLIPNQNFKVKGYIPFTDIDVDHPQGIKFMLLFLRKELNQRGS